MNEILTLVNVTMAFVAVLLFYKFFGKTGLFAWSAFAVVLANIEVSKCIDIFSFSTTLGNALFASTFLATDILSEMYGYNVSKKNALVCLISVISFQLFIQLDLVYIPNSEDFVSSVMNELFALSPRICFASVSMMFVSSLFNARIFKYLKEKFPKHLWLRNNVSTIVCQVIENFFFHMIAFYGVFSLNTICELTLTVSAIEIIIALFDTPFLYIARKIKVVNEI